jgi:hypothetical protein
MIASQSNSENTLKYLYNDYKDTLDMSMTDKLSNSAWKLSADEYIFSLVFFMLKGADAKILSMSRLKFSSVDWYSS